MKTRMTELFGVKHPIMLAGMNWLTKPKLVSAVSNAGGLCILSCQHYDPDSLRNAIKTIRELTDKTFGVNITLGMGSQPLVQVIIETLESDVLRRSSRKISIASFLQMVQIEQKTCLLEIAPPNGEKGYICIKNGELYDAAFRGLEGEEAASEMITLGGASVRFKNHPKTELLNG